MNCGGEATTTRESTLRASQVLPGGDLAKSEVAANLLERRFSIVPGTDVRSHFAHRYTSAELGHTTKVTSLGSARVRAQSWPEMPQTRLTRARLALDEIAPPARIRLYFTSPKSTLPAWPCKFRATLLRRCSPTELCKTTFRISLPARYIGEPTFWSKCRSDAAGGPEWRAASD